MKNDLTILSAVIFLLGALLFGFTVVGYMLVCMGFNVQNPHLIPELSKLAMGIMILGSGIRLFAGDK